MRIVEANIKLNCSRQGYCCCSPDQQKLYESLRLMKLIPSKEDGPTCIQDLVGMVHCGTYYKQRSRKEDKLSLSSS